MQTIQDSAIVTMESEYELICNLSNGDISNLLNEPNPVFKVTPVFDARYLADGYRYAIVTIEGE